LFTPNKRISLLASFIIIANYLFILALYGTHTNFFDHAEATIATVSWLFQTGKPIYHGLDSAERYTIPYGPMLYVINGLFLNLLKPSIFSAKIGGILAGGLSLLLIFLSLKKVVGSKIAVFCSAYISLTFVSIYVYFAAATFWNRSDSFLLMFVALGLLAVVKTNSLWAIILSALSLGISVNLKIHAFLYFLPIYVLLFSQYGIYSTLASLLGSIILTIAPFICLPQVSINNYILWLSEFREQGIALNLLRGNIIWSIYLLAPIFFLFIYFYYVNKRIFFTFINKQKIFIYSILISLIAVDVIGSKQGAGMNHLIPFYPVFSYLFALALAQAINVKKKRVFRAVNKYAFCAYLSLVLALFTVTLLRGVLNENRLIALSTKYNSEPIKEINQIVKSHPGITIGMGYGGNYDLTYYRPILVYDGNPYLIDAVSVMDAEFLGKTIPPKTLEALSSCQTKLWLIPKGDVPFKLYNYFNHRQVFSDELKSTFLANYELKEQTKYYNLWFCKKKDTSSNEQGLNT
jgi:4-amino-4-deoxy-L-arabinose transferase-like glycosyltransferase